MGLFNIFKSKEEISNSKNFPQNNSSIKRGTVKLQMVDVNADNYDDLLNEYIAFDTETTGLNPSSCRIVELGAIYFKNGKPVRTFSSLVNPKVHMPKDTSKINGITDLMLYKAPSEEEIYPEFIEFLGDAAKGRIHICAHNANFDFQFLSNTLQRLGIDAHFKYVDTLKLSRQLLKNLPNHKQNTLEDHFGLVNARGHRADSDAENCGFILWNLLQLMNDSIDEQKKKQQKTTPNREEFEVCAVIQNIIAGRNGDYKSLRFYKNSGNYITVYCPFNVVQFKFAKKGKYIIIPSNRPEIQAFATEPCTVREGGGDFVRVYFSDPFELEALSDYIYNSFQSAWNSWEKEKKYHNEHGYEYNWEDPNYIAENLLELFLESAKQKEYKPVDPASLKKQVLSMSDVNINAVNNRIPVDQIKNLNDWDKGFEAGYKYYECGEEQRKQKNTEDAIRLFDIARMNGYVAPALYTSYAKAYRQLKDYENEIEILEEGIQRLPDSIGIFSTRKNKAIELLYRKQHKRGKQL